MTDIDIVTRPQEDCKTAPLPEMPEKSDWPFEYNPDLTVADIRKLRAFRELRRRRSEPCHRSKRAGLPRRNRAWSPEAE